MIIFPLHVNNKLGHKTRLLIRPVLCQKKMAMSICTAGVSVFSRRCGR